MTQEGKSKWYEFVQYENEESATTAIDKVNKYTVEGNQIYVAPLVKKILMRRKKTMKATMGYNLGLRFYMSGEPKRKQSAKKILLDQFAERRQDQVQKFEWHKSPPQR
ncbi:hypothetical protein MKW98_013297 [Papaver atlanticum]|uniref:RRM domain-containing protein n=1 Tax=Papaver atlanticum TaxID=357466 RepID=A0AAD4XE28_9MAGN|nr:hypothetical protein MKW98_013297 [Papaver atlanticum]